MQIFFPNKIFVHFAFHKIQKTLATICMIVSKYAYSHKLCTKYCCAAFIFLSIFPVSRHCCWSFRVLILTQVRRRMCPLLGACTAASSTEQNFSPRWLHNRIVHPAIPRSHTTTFLPSFFNYARRHHYYHKHPKFTNNKHIQITTVQVQKHTFDCYSYKSMFTALCN